MLSTHINVYITGLFQGYIWKVVIVVAVVEVVILVYIEAAVYIYNNNIMYNITDDIVIIYDYLPSGIIVMDCSNGTTTRYPAAIGAPL